MCFCSNFVYCIKNSTKCTVDTIINHSLSEIAAHETTVFSARSDYPKSCEQCLDQLYANILQQFDSFHQRSIQNACDNTMSVWLSVVSVEQNQFDLTTKEFWDILGVRYRKPLLVFFPPVLMASTSLLVKEWLNYYTMRSVTVFEIYLKNLHVMKISVPLLLILVYVVCVKDSPRPYLTCVLLTLMLVLICLTPHSLF